MSGSSVKKFRRELRRQTTTLASVALDGVVADLAKSRSRWRASAIGLIIILAGLVILRILGKI